MQATNTRKKTYTPKTKAELQELVGNEAVHLGDIDTSLITDMSELFKDSKREDFSGIETWDVSQVTNMSKIFWGTKSFNQPLDSWDVRKVENMEKMFAGAESFKQKVENLENRAQEIHNDKNIIYG